MKSIGIIVAAFLMTSTCFAARYEFETLYRGGDDVMGQPIFIDMEGFSPQINDQGDVVFNAGSKLVVRNADGSERIVVRQGEEIDGVTIRFDSFDIDEQGMVSHAECDDINYLARERSILSEGHYELDGRYVHSCGTSYYLSSDGRYIINGSVDGALGVFTRDSVVLARGDQFAGVTVQSALTFSSPNNQIQVHSVTYEPFVAGTTIDSKGIVVNGSLFLGTGRMLDVGTIRRASLSAINNSGDVISEIFYTRPNGETAKGVFLDDILVLDGDHFFDTNLGAREVTNFFNKDITSDGNALIGIAFSGSGPRRAIAFNDRLVVQAGIDIGNGATLASVGEFSYSPRGDIVFTGRFDDGTSRIVLARRLDPVQGDFNDNGQFDVTDINRLDAAIAKGVPDERYDMANDGQLDLADRQYWLFNIANSTYGDSNLDGTFNSQDLVVTFQAGEYEDSLVGNSNWSDGDWNGDGEFTSSDLVLAFAAGGYEASATSSASFVPEPSSMGMLVGMLMLLRLPKRQTRRVTGE